MPNDSYENIKNKGFGSGIRTTAEERELQAKGGKISGKKRKQIKTMKECAKLLATMPVINDDMRAILEAQGIDADNMTNIMAVVQAVMIKAMSGDTGAVDRLVKLLGEDNDTARLKMEQKAAKTNTSNGKLDELLKGLKDE